MMKERISGKVLSIFVIMCMLLSGCGRQENIQESKQWSKMPQLTYGVLEYEQLEVLPWYSGRAEAISYNRIAETADGYYCTHASRLYYSDKDEPELWVPVCNKPNCKHFSYTTCNASVSLGTFIIHNDRIYFEELAGRNPHLYNKQESDFILVSTKRDGTDKQLVYAIEDERLISNNGGSGSTLLTPTMWLYTTAEFRTDGSTITRVYKVDEKGQQLILEKEGNAKDTSSGWKGGLYGDKYYLVSAMSTDSLLRFENGEIQKLDISAIPEARCYISGDIIRYFVQNEGYFDRNIKTGEEVKLAPAQMENSDALIVLPNCIVESTLLTDESQAVAGGHTMRIFDGNEWHTVRLPKELQEAEEVALILKTVTSDSIFFSYTKKVTVVENGKEYIYNDLLLYRIPIGKGSWNLEYYGTIQQPREHSEG